MIVGLAQHIAPNEPWMRDALCAQTDPEIFWPTNGGSTAPAKKVCRACTVTNDCLAYALRRNEQGGIWGGLGDRERARLRRGLRPAA